MSDPTNPADWVEKAEEDYALMLSSLRRKHPHDGLLVEDARDALATAKTVRAFARRLLK